MKIGDFVRICSRFNKYHKNIHDKVGIIVGYNGGMNSIQLSDLSIHSIGNLYLEKISKEEYETHLVINS